jgi:histidinol-phosphate phosphatase family protein
MFLAEDGIVVHDGPPSLDPRRMRLVTGAGSALQLLRDAGFSFHVISHQPGVARGLFDEEELAPVRIRLDELLAAEGIPLADFSYCPHDPHGVRRGYAVDCVCRTPRPGLLMRAAREHDLDIARSWLIGDRLDDIEAGVRAGCRTVLLDDGREREWRLSETRLPHHMALGLDEAALLVLEDEHVLDWRERAVATPAR